MSEAPTGFDRREPFPIPAALAAAYRATHFEIEAEPRLVLRVGARSPEADALLAARCAGGLVLITAWNPFSEAVDEARNRAAQQALEADVAALELPWLPGCGRDPAGAWPGEPCLAVLDAAPAQIERWLVRFGQAAALQLKRGEAARLIWHPDAIPPASPGEPEGPVGPADYLRRIQQLLSESFEGAGSFKELHTRPDGTELVHRFSWATSMGWLHDQSQYERAFGALPDWVAPLHPGQRRGLVELALQLGSALPDRI